MNKPGAYLGMVVIAAALAAGDAYLLLSSATLSRRAREEIERLAEGRLEVLDVQASLDGTVTLEGVRIPLGGPGFRAQEADRITIETGGLLSRPLRVRRITVEGARVHLSPALFEELGKGTPKKTIRDLFPDPDAIPQVVVRGGRLEAGLPEVFPGGPQPVLLREWTITPLRGYRLHVQGIFESPLYGRWSAAGEVDPDAGRSRMRFETAFLTIEPRMREPMAPKLQNIYRMYLPGGTCDLTVELGKEPGSEADVTTTLVARDMQLNYTYFPYQVDRMTGEIAFYKRGFHVKHMTARHGDALIRFEGRADGYPEDSRHDFRFELENVPLDDELRAALRENSRKAWDRFSPRGVVSARGTARREAGAGQRARIPVEIHPEGATLTFREFPWEMRNVTGEILVDGDRIQITRVRSKDGDATVEVSGEIRDLTGDATVDVSIDARAVPLDDRLKRAVSEDVRKTWDLLSPGGSIDARSRLTKEAGKELVHATTLRARGNTVRHRDFPIEVSGLEGEVEATSGLVRLHRVTGKAHGARVGMHGTVAGDAVDLDVDAAGLVIDDGLKAALPAEAGELLREIKLGGVVGFMAGYKSRKGGQRQFTVDLKISKGVLDLEPRVEEAEGHVALEGFHDKELLLRGPITFSTATVGGKRVTDVGASLNVKGHRVNLVNLKATSYGGLVAGKSFSIDTKTGEFFSEGLTVDRLDLREFSLDTAGYAKRSLGGKASLTIQDLAGRAADAKTITGKGRLSIRDGLLWEVPVFVSLFTLNPQELFKSKQQFDTGAVDFELKERRISIEKLSFSSEGVSVLGRGTVDFDGNLDLVLKTKTGFFGIDFLPLNLVTGLFDELKGAFHGVAVTGTFEKPETSQKFFPGISK